jgi:hypothetical protein
MTAARRIRAVLPLGLLLWAAACGEPEPAQNPIERRVEPVRTQTATADSLMRAHEARVAEMVDQMR